MFTDIKNLPSTVKTLNRAVNGVDDNRNQSFSSVPYREVKVSGVRKVVIKRNGQEHIVSRYVDPKQLRMNTDSDKMASHASLKKMNNNQPSDAIARIDRKIIELLGKLDKATRFGKDTTILHSLLLRCQYRKHTETVRLRDLAEKLDERSELPLVGQIATHKPTNVGHINRDGKTIPNGGISVPLDKLAIGDTKPIVPASIGRSYKVKRRILKDRVVKHGPAEPGTVAIKARSTRKSRKAKVRKGAGSF